MNSEENDECDPNVVKLIFDHRKYFCTKFKEFHGSKIKIRMAKKIN